MICEPINTNDAVSVKRCTKCGEIKALEEFSFRDKKKGELRADCKICKSGYMAKYYQSTKDDVYKKHSKKLRNKKRYENDIINITLKNSLYSALKRRPTENPITPSELIKVFECQNGKCALSGIEMVCGKGKTLWNSMSIDRINSELGYTLENVRLVCFCINAFRGQMTDNEFDEVITKLYNHRRNS